MQHTYIFCLLDKKLLEDPLECYNKLATQLSQPVHLEAVLQVEVKDVAFDRLSMHKERSLLLPLEAAGIVNLYTKKR